MVASTVQRTGEAARAVDDLAETLAIFDLKLRHMREAGLRVLSLLPWKRCSSSRVACTLVSYFLGPEQQAWPDRCVCNGGCCRFAGL